MAIPPSVNFRWPVLRLLQNPVCWGVFGWLALLGFAGHQAVRTESGFEEKVSTAQGQSLDRDNLPGTSLLNPGTLLETENLAALLNQIQPTTVDLAERPSPLVEQSEENLSRLDLPTPESPKVLAPSSAVLNSPFKDYLERLEFPGQTAAGNLYRSRPDRRLSLTVERSTSSPFPIISGDNELRPQPAQNALEQAYSAQSNAAGWTPSSNINPVTNRVVPTTPQMSPPAGTTGYVLPPVLEASPSVSPTLLDTSPKTALPQPNPARDDLPVADPDISAPIVTPSNMEEASDLQPQVLPTP